MAENLNLKTVDTVDTRPFKKLVMTIGELSTSFIESMTYYELLAWFTNYLETVIIPTVNNNAEAVKELQDLFTELKNFVDNYFDNLDVQEEINNKLDAMAESGQLQEIIAQYVNLIKIYNTQAELLADTFVASGFAKTLGLATKGDGFGAYYEIGETGDLELASGAYATMISNFGGNNYYNFTTEMIRRHHTTCYVTIIPLNDGDGNQINPYIGKTNGTGAVKYAQDNNTSLSINASLGTHTLISNGEVIQDYDSTNPELPTAAYYLGLNDERELIDFQAITATGAGMISAGATQAWLAYYRILTAGVKEDFDAIDTSWAEWPASGDHIATDRNPRQCIGQKTDKTIVILTCNGRRSGEWGLTSDECADIMLEYGVYNAWNLDGGGSTSTVVRGYKINSNIDDNFTTDRHINATLNIKNLITNEELAKVNTEIGKLIGFNNNSQNILFDQTLVKSINLGDADELVNEQALYYMVQSTNTPAQAGYMMVIPITATEHLGNYAKQIFTLRDNTHTYTRSLVNGVFTEWLPTEGYIGHIFDLANIEQTITADETYENILFDNPKITTNVSYFKDDFITISENKDSLTINGPNRDVIIEFTFDMKTSATAGQRYLRLFQGANTIVSNSVSRFDPTTNYVTHTITGVCAVNSPIKFQYYGKSGDKINRTKIVVRSLY